MVLRVVLSVAGVNSGERSIGKKAVSAGKERTARVGEVIPDWLPGASDVSESMSEVLRSTVIFLLVNLSV
jgi:hypothetical protein